MTEGGSNGNFPANLPILDGKNWEKWYEVGSDIPFLRCDLPCQEWNPRGGEMCH